MTTEKEALTNMYMYALHKFCHHLFGDKFIFYVDHMVLLYLIENLRFQGEYQGDY
jgi:hypothetical protein